MKGRKYSYEAVESAILRAGPSKLEITRDLGCSRNTLKRWLKADLRLQGLLETLQVEIPEASGGQYWYSRNDFLAAMRFSCGLVSGLAAAVGCTRQTVYNAMERWPELRAQLEVHKMLFVRKAALQLFRDVDDRSADGHQKAYMFVLKTLGREDGFSERVEVDANVNVLPITPELRQLLRENRLQGDAVVREFETMLRARAASQPERDH